MTREYKNKDTVLNFKEFTIWWESKACMHIHTHNSILRALTTMQIKTLLTVTGRYKMVSISRDLFPSRETNSIRERHLVIANTSCTRHVNGNFVDYKREWLLSPS